MSIYGNNGKNKYDKPVCTGLCVNNRGYIHIGVAFNGQTLTGDLHRLACLGNENETVNHIDGNKWNNHYSNLEWCTYQYNNKHATINGLNKHIKRVTNNKNEVYESTTEAAKAYGVDRKTIYNECEGLHKSRLGLDWRWCQ